MALGVRRDSISRLRATSRRSATSAAARSVRVCVIGSRGGGEGPRGGPGARQPPGAVAGHAGGQRAEEGVREEVVAGDDDDERDEQRVQRPEDAQRRPAYEADER